MRHSLFTREKLHFETSPANLFKQKFAEMQARKFLVLHYPYNPNTKTLK